MENTAHKTDGLGCVDGCRCKTLVAVTQLTASEQPTTTTDTHHQHINDEEQLHSPQIAKGLPQTRPRCLQYELRQEATAKD